MIQHLLLIALVCLAFSLGSRAVAPTIRAMMQRASADLDPPRPKWSALRYGPDLTGILDRAA
ncbi:hypothetical protein DK427_09245 [Methylobacterium radiodurans]|uniref:Uncharacterized protein n=1 Tax=Methylobacterium radiodurans TaxID=2202828 RepID=A0A2U8VR44_9HYPH|nr:hypothetical protein DK427_09245 [Methylobacterium radiodurans]